MSQTVDFILERAAATRNVQARILEKWSWDELTLEEWDQRIERVKALHEQSGEGKVDRLSDRGTLDVALAQLHARTVQGVGMARQRYRNNPEKLTLVKALKSGGQSRDEILDQGLAWEQSWEKLDAGWAPMAGNTLEAFKALRQKALAAGEDYEEAHVDVRAVGATLAYEAAALNELAVAWYGNAVLAFLEGTPEGDLIRTIPTTHVPEAAEAPPSKDGKAEASATVEASATSGEAPADAPAADA